MIVPDVNLLIYAVQPGSPFHDGAARWLEGLLAGDEPVGLPWAVALAFVRLTTNGRAFSPPLSVDTALDVVDGWRARRVVTMIGPGEGHWPVVRALLTEAGAAGNLTPDAHVGAPEADDT